MKVNFDKITEIALPARAEGDEQDPAADNLAEASAVLRNWCAAAAWGLPTATVAEILDEASKRLRARPYI